MAIHNERYIFERDAPPDARAAFSPHVSQLGRKEINVGSLGLVREFCVALLVALRVFRFEQ